MEQQVSSSGIRSSLNEIIGETGLLCSLYPYHLQVDTFLSLHCILYTEDPYTNSAMCLEACFMTTQISYI